MLCLSGFILATLTPRVLSPFLRAIGDERAADALCVPESKARLTLVVIGAPTFAALAWTLSALMPSSGALWKAMRVIESIAIGLNLSAMIAGVVMLLGLSQRSADRFLGHGFAALVGLAATLSSLVVILLDISPVWLMLWFPLCTVLGQMTRSVTGAAWKISSGLLGLLLVASVLQAYFAGALFGPSY